MHAVQGSCKCPPIPAATVGYLFKPLADKCDGRLLLLLSNDPPAEPSNVDQRHPKVSNGCWGRCG